MENGHILSFIVAICILGINEVILIPMTLSIGMRKVVSIINSHTDQRFPFGTEVASGIT